ncbi:MAG: hypothetical protein JWO67_6182 [Streptosporangiaceae bacterium]|nr:hypothetical protein [Streptosporangiaceae bacterium]
MRAAPPPAYAKRPSRAALLAAITSLGIGAAAVAVAGALLATPLHGKMARFTAPLNVYPVSRTTPGPCTAGTKGVNGQSPNGPACYQVTDGIAIHRVNDIHVQRGGGGGFEVAISLLPPDQRAFARLTRAMTGRDVAFVVRERLVTATRVEAPITHGKVIIAGSLTRADADRLVRELKGAR